MTLVAVQTYVKSLLDGMAWPAKMAALQNPPPNLQAFITPPDPNAPGEITPTAYIWMWRGDESRNPAPHGAGTIPRAAFRGGPSGTKADHHTIPIYLVWNGENDDPAADTLFPGMVDAIKATLRVAPDPAGQPGSPLSIPLTDPWTDDQSWAVDIGENISYEQELRALMPQRLDRWDALITISVVEVIAG